MLLVTYLAVREDRTTVRRTLEIGRIRGGTVADYLTRECSTEGGVIAEARLEAYPRWTEHVSGLAARCAHLLWHSSESGHVAHPSAELGIVKAARIDIGFGSQRHGMRRSLERIEYVRTGFAPRIRVAREHWPAYEYPAPAKLAADTGAIVALLALATWSTTDIAELPSPLAVPVRSEGDGPPVVRLVDIPEPARTAFDRRLQGATVPSPDNAYAWDWIRFIEGT